jgi:hypothetical protein
MKLDSIGNNGLVERMKARRSEPGTVKMETSKEDSRSHSMSGMRTEQVEPLKSKRDVKTP